MRKIINEKKSVGIREICGTKIINKKNLCKSVKSVGLKQSMRKKTASSAKSA